MPETGKASLSILGGFGDEEDGGDLLAAYFGPKSMYAVVLKAGRQGAPPLAGLQGRPRVFLYKFPPCGEFVRVGKVIRANSSDI